MKTNQCHQEFSCDIVVLSVSDHSLAKFMNSVPGHSFLCCYVCVGHLGQERSAALVFKCMCAVGIHRPLFLELEIIE